MHMMRHVTSHCCRHRTSGAVWRGVVSRWVRPTNIHVCFSVDRAQLRLDAATQDTTTGPTDALCWSIHGPAQKRPPAANPQYHTLSEDS